MPTVSQRSQQYVRNRVQQHMAATVTLYRYGSTEFDDDTGMVEVPSRSSIYEGIARIWQTNEGQVVIAGDSDIATLTTNISIPWDSVMPCKDDIVVVKSNPGDVGLVGRAFRVLYVDGGGLIGGARRMQCSALADSAVWSQS